MLFSFNKENTPTDKKILEAIYNRYYDKFSSYKDNNEMRESKIYIPIDIEMIAKDLKVDEDIIFGRLYYHLEKKYGYTNENGTNVYFFALKIGDDKYCVHFPYLASILANLRKQNQKFKITQSIAILPLLISIISWFV